MRPTSGRPLMYLAGLKDDYEHDGRVITQILADPNRALSGPGVAGLGACYKQLNSSVGQFGAYTLQADTKAIESSSAGDARYTSTDKALTGLDKVRDALALRIKGELEAAAFGNKPIFGGQARRRSPARRSSPGPPCWRITPDHRCGPPPRGGGPQPCSAPGAGVAQLGGDLLRPAARRGDPGLDRLHRHPGPRHHQAQPRPLPRHGAGRGRRPPGGPGPAGGRVRGRRRRRSHAGRRGRRAGRTPRLPSWPNGPWPRAPCPRSSLARRRSARWPGGPPTSCSTG